MKDEGRLHGPRGQEERSFHVFKPTEIPDQSLFCGLVFSDGQQNSKRKKSKLEKMRLFIPPKGKKLAIFSPLSRYIPRREIKTDRNRPSFPFCIFYEPPFAFHHHQPVFALPIGQLFTHHSVGQLRKTAGCTASMRVLESL